MSTNVTGSPVASKHARGPLVIVLVVIASASMAWASVRGPLVHPPCPEAPRPCPRLLAEYGLFALGDKGYDGLDHDLVVTPIKGKPEWQKEVNRLHTQLRGPGKRVFAQLKIWAILDQVRCAPERVTQIAIAI